MSHRQPSRKPRFRAVAGALLALAALSGASTDAQEATYVTDVRLVPGDDAPVHSILIENGRIEKILDGTPEAPLGVRIVDGEGRLCLPAFVDAYATTGVETPEPRAEQDRPVNSVSDVRIEMRQANRKGLQPTFRAATALDLKEPAEAWRKAGFALAVVSPSSELLAGDGCLVTTRDAAPRDVVVDAETWGHAAFRASGSGYPSTLMGYVTQLRQMFMDADRHAGLVDRQRAGRAGDRPRWDPELEAAARFLRRGKRLVCEADSARDMERWIRIADEFGLEILFSGGTEAWRLAETLSERKIPVLLSLDWGDEVEDPDEGDDEESSDEEEPEEGAAEADKPEKSKRKKGKKSGGKLDEEWIYVEPIEVRRERRRLWEQKRDCAMRLRDAGVPFAFGSSGEKPSELLEKVRDLVEAGLTRDEALAALTSTPAQLVGQLGRIGRVDVGFDAHLTLWTDDPFTAKDAKAAWVVIEGHAVDLEVPVEEDDDEDENSEDDQEN